MAFPRPSAPSSLWRDLKALAPRERHQQVFMALSLFITIMIFGVFALDFRQAHVIPAQIIYVESWPKGRTDAEIKKQQKIDSAAMHAAQKARQRELQKLADALGIDYR
jgi:hypothetical protein